MAKKHREKKVKGSKIAKSNSQGLSAIGDFVLPRLVRSPYKTISGMGLIFRLKRGILESEVNHDYG